MDVGWSVSNGQQDVEVLTQFFIVLKRNFAGKANNG
jgi:hypothetical protein